MQITVRKLFVVDGRQFEAKEDAEEYVRIVGRAVKDAPIATTKSAVAANGDANAPIAKVKRHRRTRAEMEAARAAPATRAAKKTDSLAKPRGQRSRSKDTNDTPLFNS